MTESMLLRTGSEGGRKGRKGKGLTAARAVLVQGGLSTCMVLVTDLSGLVLFNAILEWTWYFVTPLPPFSPQEKAVPHLEDTYPSHYKCRR